MMEKHKKVVGVVLAEHAYGENGKRLTILTQEYGRLTAFAGGAKKTKSTLLAASQMFVFAHFELYQGKGAYTLTGAEIIDSFYHLRSELEMMALASYLGELSLAFVPEEMGSRSLLKLIYLAFEEMQRHQMPLSLIKATFELKLLALLGYMPDISACAACENSSDLSAFRPEQGMICKRCALKSDWPVFDSVRQAMKYIMFSKVEKSFRYSLNEKPAHQFSNLMQKIMAHHLDYPLKSELFLKEIGLKQ